MVWPGSHYPAMESTYFLEARTSAVFHTDAMETSSGKQRFIWVNFWKQDTLKAHDFPWSMMISLIKDWWLMSYAFEMVSVFLASPIFVTTLDHIALLIHSMSIIYKHTWHTPIGILLSCHFAVKKTPDQSFRETMAGESFRKSCCTTSFFPRFLDGNELPSGKPYITMERSTTFHGKTPLISKAMVSIAIY